MRATAIPDPQAGVTLVELIMTIVIISVSLSITVIVISKTTSRSADPLMTHKAILLAQSYTDEILGKRFAEATPSGGAPAVIGATACTIGAEGGEARTTFDDVDDYHDVTDAPPVLQSAGNLSGYADFSVTVAVACAGTALGLTNNHDAKRVIVTVTSPDTAPMTFTTYRGNY